MWKRRIILSVTKKTQDSKGNDVEEVQKVFSGHRIDFTYFSLMGGRAADTCEIKIFNLGVDNIKFFADGTRKKTESLSVKLQAGYEDEYSKDADLPVILEGEVMNVFGQRILPEHITTLYCVPHEGRTYNSKVSRLIVAGRLSVKEVLEKFARDENLGVVKFRVEPEEEAVLSSPMENFTTDGTTLEILKRITAQHHLLFNIIPNGILVTTVTSEEQMQKKLQKQNTSSYENTADKKVFLLNSNLLRATPDIQLCRFEAKVAMNVSMQPLDLVDVSKINGNNVTKGEFPLAGLGNNSTGTTVYRDRDVAHYTVFAMYQIESLVHVGSNYTQTWETSFKSFVLRDNNSDNGDLNQKQINVRTIN